LRHHGRGQPLTGFEVTLAAAVLAVVALATAVSGAASAARRKFWRRGEGWWQRGGGLSCVGCTTALSALLTGPLLVPLLIVLLRPLDCRTAAAHWDGGDSQFYGGGAAAAPVLRGGCWGPRRAIAAAGGSLAALVLVALAVRLAAAGVGGGGGGDQSRPPQLQRLRGGWCGGEPDERPGRGRPSRRLRVWLQAAVAASFVFLRRTVDGAGGGGSDGSNGESFLRVHWVAMPKVLRARRVNRGGGRR
jgi:hypothetical protein